MTMEYQEKDYQKVIDLIHSTKKMIIDGSSAIQITEKGPSDFVTQVDLRVQEYMIAELKRHYPHIQIMAEEKENHYVDLFQPVWILDPIDGTTNLIHGFRHSSVSLALYDGKRLVFGVVYNPFTEETFHAVAGKGSYLNNKRVQVSGEKTLDKSLIIVGTASYYKNTSEENFEAIYRVFRSCQDIRRSGAASLDLAYVSCGRAEGFFEPILKPWDIAAGMLLVQEAGGKTSRYNGYEVKLDKATDIVADNGKIHESFLKVIKG